MKNRFITVYSSIVAVIYLIALIFPAYKIFQEYDSGISRTRKQFELVTSNFQNSSFSISESDKLNSQIESLILNKRDYAKFLVTKDGITIYDYSSKKNIPQVNTKYIRLYFNSVNKPEGTYTIMACMYTIRPSVILYFVKISFLIILFFTCLTIILIIFYNTSNAKEADNSEDDFSSFTTPDSLETSELETTSINNTNATDITTEQKSDSEEIAVIKSETFPETEKETLNSSEEEITPVANVTKSQAQEVQNADTFEEKVELPLEDVRPSQNEDTPKGLFSPLTGFGWESYLKTRLDSELERACASEFDVVLFLIKIQNISRDSETIKPVCEYLKETFQFTDMIFEYRNDTFACIKTSINIDDAIPLADKIHLSISELLNGHDAKCFIGLTSRTIRLVSGERMLIEADAALDHAIESPDSPIIAFRANAEKYMKFVDENK